MDIERYLLFCMHASKQALFKPGVLGFRVGKEGRQGNGSDGDGDDGGIRYVFGHSGIRA